MKLMQKHSLFIHRGHIALFPNTLHHSTESIDGFVGERLAIVGYYMCAKKEYLQFSTGFISPQHWKIYSELIYYGHYDKKTNYLD